MELRLARKEIIAVEASSPLFDVERGRSALRALVDTTTSERFFYHKDWFERGACSQLYVGVDPTGQTCILKRLSFLPPLRPESDRSILPTHYQRAAHKVSPALANREANCLQHLAPMLGARLRVLTTMREGPDRHDVLSKFFLVMPAAHGDMIECLMRLPRGEQGRSLRRAVARAVIEGLLGQLRTMHAMGVVHGDIRAPNLLLLRNDAGLPVIELGDFGHSRTGRPPGSREVREDGAALALVVLKVLFPELHGARKVPLSEALNEALDICDAREPDWSYALSVIARAAWNEVLDALPAVSNGDRAAALTFWGTLNALADNVEQHVQQMRQSSAVPRP